MQTEQAHMHVVVAVYPSGTNYLAALALDCMRWVTGEHSAPSVGRVEPNLDAFVSRGMMLLTRADARLTECDLGPMVAVPEGGLLLECEGWANV